MWQQVQCFCYFHSFCSSDWIPEDPMPSYGHLLSSWFTGGYVHSALICLAWLFNISLYSAHIKAPDIVMRGKCGIKSKKAFGWHFPPSLNPAPDSWAKLFHFCLSINDDIVPGLHLCPPSLMSAIVMLGKDKQQQGALISPLVFPCHWAKRDLQDCKVSECYILCSTVELL